ncbi:Tripartite-type tricarboxylate transporter, receptor component TctC [Cohaesibacter sp. ES.047]|uniref:tripartite tricarboxylate transporter substrate binding protein n=1 Tax=Cohaesibacter sp. ES.047 TaxID=1798205 RepID=UPI000BB68C9E|nr:tripartite tricarboxylate transporter substrate binding protein [Cohaesibacter sp. ES.047]SNY90302.1 Tripartite-type tricarboxylate transporter, receptor component TctC [Cohaesibacter sp. ES.047]
MKSLFAGLFLASVALTSNMAFAADGFPKKDITIVVQYATGGGTDSFIRALEKPLEDAFGVGVAVRNIAGGGGVVGMMQVLAAKPDGYTVAIANNAFYTLIGMGNVTFSLDDFDYIAAVGMEPYVLAAKASDEWKDYDGFLNYAKDKTIRLGFAGVGSSTHIMAMAMAEELGLNVQFVPYGGASEAAAAALGGHIEGVVLSPADLVAAMDGDDGLVPIVSSGKSSLIENVKTTKDLGLNLSVQQWRGFAAPAGVDPEVKKAWQAAIEKAIKDPQFIEASKNLGVEVSPVFGEDLKAFMDEGERVMIPLAKKVAAQ